MKLFIDDAHIDAIKEMYAFYPVDGVTTNPSILARTGRNPLEVLAEIRQFIQEDTLFVQAVAMDAEGMIADAHKIMELYGEHTVVKIPSVPEGFRAMKTLCRESVPVCATVVYTPMQAYLAAKLGARYVAPYVNRIDNMGYDGVKVVQEIQDILDSNGYACEVLAASFKNSQQVKELAMYGVGASTASPDVIRGFVKNVAIDGAVQDFVQDFRKLTGKTRFTDITE